MLLLLIVALLAVALGQGQEVSDDGQSHQIIDLDANRKFHLNTTIGGQDFSLALDTTSNNIWVYDSSVKHCNGKTNKDKDGGGKGCVNGQRFDKDKSDTFKDLHAFYNVTSPGEGSYASGSYGQDKFKMKDFTLDNVTFGIVNTSTREYTPGMFGVGFLSSFGQNDGHSGMSADFITSLVFSRLIYSPVVSLWANRRQHKGSLTIGAFDKNKFKGKLYVMPLNKPKGGVEHLPFIQLSQLTVTNKGNRENITGAHTDVPVMIDSSHFYSRLPFDIIVNLAQQMGSYYAKDMHMWVQSCEYKSLLSGTVNFHFYDAVIKVPAQDLLVELTGDDGSPRKFQNGDHVCALAFKDSATQGYSSLGASFLSNMYTVFDLNYFRVGVAQSINNSNSEDLKVVKNNLTKIDDVSMITPSSQRPYTINKTDTSTEVAAIPKVWVSNGEFITSGSAITIMPTNDDPGPTRYRQTGSTKTSVASLKLPPTQPVYASIFFMILTLIFFVAIIF